MVGRYKLEINGLKVKYKIAIERQITIIKGDSGTGKSTLWKVVSEALKGSKGYSSNMIEKIYTLDELSPWEMLIKTLKNKIIFIDENSRYVYSSDFTEVAQRSDNYFVIISRRSLDNMVYSYKSIYELKTNKNNGICETELIYKFRDNIGNNTVNNHNMVICEDRKSGYQMMKLIIDNSHLETASGKDNIAIKIGSNRDKIYYVIADGAGFGNCIESIVALFNEGVRMTLLLDESFEKMILDYPVFYNMCKKKLDETFMFCDTKLFKSYERYYTYLLNEICKKLYNKQYSKSRLISELKQNDIVAFICNKLLYINKELLLNNKGE